jgi:hypothetical protein
MYTIIVSGITILTGSTRSTMLRLLICFGLEALRELRSPSCG